MRSKFAAVTLTALIFVSCASKPAASQPEKAAVVRPSPTITVSSSEAPPPPPPAAPQAAVAPALPQPPQTAAPASLYQRLGGYDAISAVTDEFLHRMITDRQLGRFFVGLSTPSKDTLRQHVVEFLCHQTGGPCSYVGRGIDEVHTGLGITEPDWKIAVGVLSATLDKFHVPATEKGELISAVAKFKDDIVGK
jgi:hemoglobin